jgi:hypothetical protein
MFLLFRCCPLYLHVGMLSVTVPTCVYTLVCCQWLYRPVSTRWYVVSDCTDLCPVTAMIWADPYMFFAKTVAPVAHIEWLVYIWDKLHFLLSSDINTLSFFSPMAYYNTIHHGLQENYPTVSAIIDHLMDVTDEYSSHMKQQDDTQNLKYKGKS